MVTQSDWFSYRVVDFYLKYRLNISNEKLNTTQFKNNPGEITSASTQQFSSQDIIHIMIGVQMNDSDHTKCHYILTTFNVIDTTYVISLSRNT